MKTTKLLALLMLVIAVTLFCFTSCDALADITSKIPGIGGTTHQHIFSDATCTTPATCTECGATEGEALGHTWADATCEAPRTCSACKTTEGEALGHTWADATCNTPKTCSACNATEGEALGHTWANATCDTPKTCSVCKATEGEALGHTWDDATCNTPKTCSVCNTTEGEALGHTPGAEATCTTAQTCTVCGTELVEKLGHVDANLDIACDREGCTTNIAPQAETLLSNFTANKLGSTLSTSNMYYVEGTIVEVLDAKNGVFYIDDGTGEKFYFRLPVNADGVSHAYWTVKLVLGDKVRVYGKINKFSAQSAPNGSYWPSIQGGLVTILEQHPHDFTFKPATCSDPAYCTCGQSHGEALGCTDTDGDNLCDDCGKNVNYVYEFIELRTDNGSGVHDATALTYTWSNDNFSVQVAKSMGGNLYVSSNNHMRMYKGNDLIIANKNGLVVKTITIYATNETQLNNIVKFLGAYTCTTNKDKFSATFEVDNIATLTLADTTGTIQIRGIEFGYEKPAPAEPIKVTLNNTIRDAQNSSMTGGNDAEVLGLDPTIFSVVADQGEYSAFPNLYYKSTLTTPSQIRLFNHSSANGNSITVSIAEGYEIVSIKITFAITGRANGYVITNGEGAEIANVAIDATIENIDAEYNVNSGSFTFKNVHTGNSKQIWIASIEITYQPK